MYLKQYFDSQSSTFTYLLACVDTKQAVIIDPVVSNINDYLTTIRKHQFQLTFAIDTHVHADHITALGDLRDKTGAITCVGKKDQISCADRSLVDGETISFGSHKLLAMYTPGHTDDSYCLMTHSDNNDLLFTGDTLLIGGTGRTDFQNGSPDDLYNSLHNKLLTLSDETKIYPGHDYHGKTSSTIGEERRSNVRLNITNRGAFIDFMNKLNLPNPKQMDIAIPVNNRCGQTLKAVKK